MIAATATLAAVSCVFGAIGVRDVLSSGGDASPLNVAFGVLALFVLNGGFHTADSVPLVLEIAQLTAPASTALAAIVALHARFRERSLRRNAQKLRNHVVVLGAGRSGLRVLRSLSDNSSTLGDRVVVVEPQPSGEVRSMCRRQGWAVLTGDASSNVIRARAALAAAADVFIATGNDARDLEVARAIGSAATAAEHCRTHVHVRLDSGLLARELMKGAMRVTSENGCIIDYVDRHSYEVMAVQEVLLVRLAAKFTSNLADQVADRAAFVGRSPLSMSASELMARSLAARSQLGIPWIVGAVDRSDDLSCLSSEGTRLVCVSDVDASSTMTMALTAARRREVVAVVALIDSGGAPRWLDDREQVLLVDADYLLHTAGALRYGYIELMAQLIHADYIAKERRRGTLSETKPTHRDWSDLDEATRDQNRSQAAFFLESLPSSGRRLDEVGAGTPAPYSHDEVERFARQEHLRWIRAQQDRTHTSLVPWEQLTEADKDRDRETIVRRPALAALLGLEIVRD